MADSGELRAAKFGAIFPHLDGVDRPDLYDPKINRSYAELAAHYGLQVDPARSRKPRDKGLASHCTSWARCGGYWLGRFLLPAGRPVALRGVMSGSW